MEKVTNDQDKSRLLEIWADAFNMKLEQSERFASRMGMEQARFIKSAGEIATALGVHDFGQYYGGKCLRCAGIAAVAATPRFRSKGLTRILMQEMLREQHGEGVPISALYASTRSLYRKVGYENAGSQYQITLPNHSIDVKYLDAELLPVGESERDIVKELHTKRAKINNGNLKRNNFRWETIWNGYEGTPNSIFLIMVEGRPEGYVSYRRAPDSDGNTALTIDDMNALTSEAGKRLLTFLADHRTTLKTSEWRGQSNDPLLMLLHEHPYKIRLLDHWMLRILDVEKALTQRGYADSVAGNVTIEITEDDVIEANNDTFSCLVENGEMQVTRGDNASPKISLSIRALAPLFSGHHSAQELQMMGMLTGTDEAIASASTIFSGPDPWMSDGF